MNLSKTGSVLAVAAAMVFVSISHAQAQRFKQGDAVDMKLGGTWMSCTVTSGYYAGGYDLKCGTGTGYRTSGDPEHIRAHQAEGAGTGRAAPGEGAPQAAPAATAPAAAARRPAAPAGAGQPGGGQPGAAGTFKVGDSVEILSASKWIPCTVSSPQYGGGYDVQCGRLNLRAKADAEHIRAHAATAAEQGTQQETKAAMANRPKGNGIGAQYGTREPAACANRGGPLTTATARQYFICDAEGEKAGYMYLVTDVTIQLGHARAFNWNQDSASTGIDTSQPVYDVRGSYNKYSCTKPTPIDNAFSRTHNCALYDEPNSEGRCYKTTFGEWHCTMEDFHRGSWPKAKDQMPPVGN